MQPIRNYTTVFWLILLLSLAACSSQPSRSQHPSADKPQSVPARQTIVATAYEMLGKPYRYGGNSPRGFDCSGLVWYTHRQAGIQVPRTTRKQMVSARRASRQSLRPGDLLFFSISHGRSRHVGIYVGEGKFIHAPSSGKKVAASRLDNPYWKKRLLQVGRYY